VGYGLKSDDVMDALIDLFITRGIPDHILPHISLGYKPPAPLTWPIRRSIQRRKYRLRVDS